MARDAEETFRKPDWTSLDLPDLVPEFNSGHEAIMDESRLARYSNKLLPLRVYGNRIPTSPCVPKNVLNAL